MAAAYADMLALPADHIGLNDDFFALGGNSLSAARVVRLLGEVLDADVAVLAMFADPTLAALAERIASGTAGATEPSVARRTALEVVLTIRARTDGVDAAVREIRQIAPRGPYHLLGWSFGGFVAHEIAARLRLAGEPVQLMLLDTDRGYGSSSRPIRSPPESSCTNSARCSACTSTRPR